MNLQQLKSELESDATIRAAAQEKTIRKLQKQIRYLERKLKRMDPPPSTLIQYAIYLLRWQASSLILWPVIQLVHLPAVWQAVISNLIGGLIFFWVDRIIFKGQRR